MTDLQAQVQQVFEFWAQASGHSRSRLDDKRDKAIRKALKWGYSVDELKLAVLGCCRTPWYSEGRNDRGGVYTHLTLILRDGDHIDRFAKLGEEEVVRSWHAAHEEASRRSHRAAGKREIPAEAKARMDALRKPRGH